MNKYNTQALIRDFPNLYRLARDGGNYQMKYGFQCGDGWFQIVYALSAKIEERSASAGLDPKSEDWPEVSQVKEKFANLRVYLHRSALVEYQDLISEAVEQSKVTCDLCGKPGVMHTKEWYYVRCEKCEKNKEALLARRDAEYDAQEKSGRYRAVIDEAFAQVDAQAKELSDEALQNVCDASKVAGGGEVGIRTSILYALGDEKIFVHSATDRDGDHEGKPLPISHKKCECGLNKSVCDEGVCERLKDVLALRKLKSADEHAKKKDIE